ncbi:Polyadenylate-binding protein rbp47c' [Dionaea muscipula]
MQSTNGSDKPQQGQATQLQQQQSQGKRQQQQQQQMQQVTAAAGGVAAHRWMAMHYPAAVLMQPQMMPQHYPPPPQYMAAYPHHAPVHPHAYMQAHPPPSPQSHHHGGGGGGHHQQQRNDAAVGENKTIWVGDLHHWMDENYLHRCFASTGEIASIKVIRNKHTGAPEGYGFVEFNSQAMAEKVLQSYAAAAMPHTANQPFRLNWATFSTGDKRNDNGSELSIFVGDLAPDVTDSLLYDTFASKYPSVKAAKVVVDANTGRSKGYGFVRFGDENERAQAMNEMNGTYCSSRAMRIGAATPRKSLGHQQGGYYASNGASPSPHRLQADHADSTNTTIFVGGLDPSVSDEDLRQSFSQYGDIISVKIPVGRGCGFVQFANRSNAEEALQKLNGRLIGKQNVRLSWGRNPANKQARSGDFGNEWNNGMYYGAHIYDGYGYPLPHPHDPSMYAAAAYGAYPVYGNQQQVS